MKVHSMEVTFTDKGGTDTYHNGPYEVEIIDGVLRIEMWNRIFLHPLVNIREVAMIPVTSTDN